ncbi:protein-glutamine glutaminase family protein [Daejeonella lutea]|uniref:Protein glutaminase domain-containing protein n=1 Tax=Daejeonella lutea TaxID=572036 RepID=A0A1T5AZ01_9SPHI|nr:protein-glutamine glutaminase family protein [Daejeonella lutea]SKB40238.1 hypothetical protein SAMN05661099_1153 [Daejeonella lutea]
MQAIVKSFLVAFIIIASYSKGSGQSHFSVNEYAVNLKNYPAYSAAEVQAAIQSVKTSEYFDYRYINSGCNFKSHYISLWLKAKFNMETFKVWNFAKNMIYPNGFGVQLKMPDPNHLTKNDSIYWGFHVAAAILQKRIVNGKTFTDTMVIDLPTNPNQSIPLSNWLTAQNQNNSYFTFTDRKYCNFRTVPVEGANIFAGVFWDDTYSMNNSLVANALARDIVVMKYLNESLLPQISNDNLMQQHVQMREQRRAQMPQMRAAKKEQGFTDEQIDAEFKLMEWKADSAMQARRYEFTKTIADISNLSLPVEYQNQITPLTTRIQNHIIADLRK